MSAKLTRTANFFPLILGNPYKSICQRANQEIEFSSRGIYYHVGQVLSWRRLRENFHSAVDDKQVTEFFHRENKKCFLL